jgi:hypothetical protein
MSVRYTATWYDVMQARQQDTHHTHRHVPARPAGLQFSLRVFSISTQLMGGGGAGVTNTGVCLGKDYFRPTNFRESLFLMHECLNRDHHRCDKPLKAKVFFILYPSRAV